MTKTAKNILELAARLSLAEIKKLQDELALLVMSKRKPPRFPSKGALIAELNRRVAELDSHPVRCVPAEEAIAQVRARLRKRDQ